MQRETCIEKIEKHNHKNSNKMLFVNVNNADDLQAIKDYFSVGYKIQNISALSSKDRIPALDEIIGLLKDSSSTTFIEGISAYLRLLGSKELISTINQLVNLQMPSKAIVLLYQCDEILYKMIQKDPRLESKIYFVDGARQVLPKIFFVKENLAKALNREVLDGIAELIRNVEQTQEECLYVKSKFDKNDFLESLYMLNNIKSFFEVVKLDYLPSLSINDESLISSENWENLAKGCFKNGDIYSYFRAALGDIKAVDFYIQSWETLNEDKKALLFIFLKTKLNASNNKCVSVAIEASTHIDEFVLQIYKSILQFNPKEKEYCDIYNERKQLLRTIGVTEHQAAQFCNFVKAYGKDGLSYLSDLTKVERKLIIEIIALYHEEISDKDLMKILKQNYRDLYYYLLEYDYKNIELTSYFNKYKQLKVKNYLDQDFLGRVEKEAKERNYNRILPTRSEKLSILEKQNSILYFLDALGVEYMSYITRRMSDFKLMANVVLCRAELPSITSLNKEFIDVFRAAKADIVEDVKALDKIKHSGTLEYDYTKKPLPTYLADELFEIDEILNRINNQIGNGYERAFIISDHGASRLAVIGKNDTKWEMVSKGEHCGRCCRVSDGVIDEASEFMTEENGYWVLANYDSIKGGRPGTVEVHGGASLEEVCVPIIEITRMPDNLKIEVLTKVIEVGYKAKPVLKFVSSEKISNVAVVIADKTYDAVSIDGVTFSVELLGMRVAKEYSFDVLSNGNVLEQGLKFKLKSAGFVDNDLL